MRSGKLIRAATGLTALALVAAACGGGSSGGSDSTLSGEINADGSSTVFPVTQAVAEEFNREHPNVKISVGVSGTGGGFEKFCAGETDLSNASRPIKESEAEKCEAAGVEYVELSVAIDGLSVLVNPENDFVDCLTVEELNAIWKPGSTVKNWNQVRPEFPDRPMTLYGPGTDSGTFDYFTDEINGEEGASRNDYTASEDDNVLVQGIAGDPGALGYFGYAYYQENADKLKVLGVDSGNGCVEPSEATINDGSYTPLSRPLFVYVAKSVKDEEQVKAFVDFYLENANSLVGDVGYIPMPEADLQEEISEWESL